MRIHASRCSICFILMSQYYALFRCDRLNNNITVTLCCKSINQFAYSHNRIGMQTYVCVFCLQEKLLCRKRLLKACVILCIFYCYIPY